MTFLFVAYFIGYAALRMSHVMVRTENKNGDWDDQQSIMIRPTEWSDIEASLVKKTRMGNIHALVRTYIPFGLNVIYWPLREAESWGWKAVSSEGV